MKIDIDRVLCEGNAICVALAPTVFDLDASDIAVVVAEVHDDRRAEVKRAVESCPRSAIVIADCERTEWEHR